MNQSEAIEDSGSEIAIVESYLAKLRKLPLLTKAQEQEICKSIELGESQILKTCVKSPEILRQILTYRESLKKDVDGKVLISMIRWVTEETSADQITQATADLFKLFDNIELYLTKPTASLGTRIVKELQTATFNTKTILAFLQPFKDLVEQMRALRTHSRLNLKILKVKDQSQFKALAIHLHQGATENKEASLKAYREKIANLAVQLESSPKMIDIAVQDQIRIMQKLCALNLLTDKQQNSVDRMNRRLFEAEQSAILAKNHLIEGNLRLVIFRAKRAVNRGLSFEDLIQEGNIGLIKAVDKFEYRKGYKFSTYATWWIDQVIGRAIADQARLIRLPVHMVEIVNSVRKAKAKLVPQLGREPSIANLCEETGFDEKTVRKALAVVKEPVSLETFVHSGGETTQSTLQDFIANSSTPTAYQLILRAALMDRVRRMLAKLPPRDEKIIRLRFGIGEPNENTLESIGLKFNLTRERIRQIEAKCIANMRKMNNKSEMFKLLFLEEV